MSNSNNNDIVSAASPPRHSPQTAQQLTAHCCRLQLHLDKKKQIKKKMNKRKFVAKLQAAVITLTMLLFVLLVLSCIIYLFSITE